MKLFGYKIEREGTTQQASAPTPSTSYLEKILSVNHAESAMRLASVYRCANLISDSIGLMPLVYKRLNTSSNVYEEYTKNDPDKLNYLLNVRPNARMNGFTFKKNIALNMDFRGNAYILALDSRGKVIEPSMGGVKQLVLVSADAVVSFDKYKNRYIINDNLNSISGTFPASMVIHIKNPSTDGGYLGESTIGYARRTLDTAATAEQETLKRFATGGKIKAILSGVGATSSFGQHKNDQMQGAALDLENKLAMQDIVALPDSSLDLKPISMTAADLQFIEQRKFAKSDIAMFFGVPLYKLGESTSNYKSIDASQIDFYTEALQPRCSQIEQEFLAKFTDPESWRKYKFDFDEKPLFALDMGSRASWMKARLESGVATVNELRQEFDMAPVPNGDNILMSANLKTLDLLAKEGGNDNNQNVEQQ